MLLTISLVAAALVLRFDVSEPGNYYLMSDNGHYRYTVEAANHVTVPCHVALTLSKDEAANKLFWVKFEPDGHQSPAP